MAMSAEVVSASLPKAAHCCMTSCSGTHSVERLERSGKEEKEAHAEVSCCSCDDRGSTVVIGGPFLSYRFMKNMRSNFRPPGKPPKIRDAALTDKGQTATGMPVLIDSHGYYRQAFPRHPT